MTKALHTLVFVIASLLLGPALALEIVPYNAAAFEQSRSAGKVVALQFHTGWCPVCILQERGLETLHDDKALANVTVYQADFAKEAGLRKRFKVRSFSTLIVFSGGEERARTTADIQGEQLRALFMKAL